MPLDRFHVLLIDDDEDDFVHIRDLLQEVTPSNYLLTWKSSYMDGLKALRHEVFDVCLLDYSLGEKTGLELMLEAGIERFSCPVIFLTGRTDFEIDLQAMQMGASDFLVKGHLTSPLLEKSIRYAIKHRYDLEEIRESRAQIVQQDRLASMGLLASSLAHEIGTPMGIIRSRAELAKKKAGDSESLKRDLESIISQIDRITQLVNALLNLAREKKSDVGGAVQIGSVVRDVLSLLTPEFNRKGIAFQANMASDLSVRAESGPLGQVLINLLVNSIHAIEDLRKAHPEEKGAIDLRVQATGGNVEITVQDNGAGISPENLSQLFKPFFTTKDIGQGTGLGLATSLRIVNSWGGDIVVASSPGECTTFKVVIPKF